MIESLSIAIETAAIGLSAFPWILVALDLLCPKARVLERIWEVLSGKRNSWVESIGKVPRLAAIGFLSAYFLALIITPLADEFFNMTWYWPATKTVLSKGDDQIRVERYFKEYGRFQRCENCLPRALFAEAGIKLPQKACLADPKCPKAIKRVYDRQKYVLMTGDQTGQILKDSGDKLVALRGGAWNGVMLFLASLGGLVAALSMRRPATWRRLLPALVPLVAALVFVLNSRCNQPEGIRVSGGDLVPVLVPLCLVCACTLRAAWTRPATSQWRHYLALFILGLVLAGGGGFGVQWLENEYDEQVILLSRYRAQECGSSRQLD